jgi:excisionase family DNA binding protein
MIKNKSGILKTLQNIMRLKQLGAKKVLTMDDVCFYTGLSKGRIRKMVSAGTIKGYRCPTGKLYFDKSDVEKWMLYLRIKTCDELETVAARYLITGKWK